ncbi:MAG TPA: hypothetical protein VK524_20170, partial [Polyangiaceae bacterium]|nr:hypothetical protein [Polyangiaceae bacterium]
MTAHSTQPSSNRASAGGHELDRERARSRALFRLMDAEARQRPAYRLARVLAVVVALACGAAMLLLISANQSKALFALAIQALGWASWTSGVTFGLSCAAPPRSQTASATQTLVLQRGFPSRGLAHAELAANTL